MEMISPRSESDTQVERTIQSSEFTWREFVPAEQIFSIAIHRGHSLPVLPDMPVD